MSAADLVAVVVTIVAVGAATGLGVATVLVVRAAAALGRSAARLDELARRLAEEVDQLATTVRDDVQRAGELVERSAGIAATLEDASRVTYDVVASPMIKVAAFAAGLRRGLARLRGVREEAPATRRRRWRGRS